MNMAETTQAQAIEQKSKEADRTETSIAARFAGGRATQGRGPLLGAVLVLALIGLGMWLYYSRLESTDDAQIDGHVNPISARVSGYVIKIVVGDNQYVKAGTVLVEIDPRDYQIAVERARAALADAEANAQAAGVNVPIVSTASSSDLTAAQAEVTNAKAGIAAAEKQADAARAQLAAAEATNVKAQNDLVRYKPLVEKEEISKQLYDQAEAVARSSFATVEAQRASALQAEQQVTQAKGRLAQAEANLRTAATAPKRIAVSRSQAASATAVVQHRKAELDQALLNLEYTRVVAPIDGVVSGRTTEVGQNVQPGQELLKLVSLDDIWVTANFKETQLRHMKPGQKAEVEVDAYGRSYTGHVESIAGASGARFSLLPPENATGNYVKIVQRIPVKIILDPGANQDHQLRPGMSVVPTVTVK